jgi:hypothetical protein
MGTNEDFNDIREFLAELFGGGRSNRRGMEIAIISGFTKFSQEEVEAWDQDKYNHYKKVFMTYREVGQVGLN